MAKPFNGIPVVQGAKPTPKGSFQPPKPYEAKFPTGMTNKRTDFLKGETR